MIELLAFMKYFIPEPTISVNPNNASTFDTVTENASTCEEKDYTMELKEWDNSFDSTSCNYY